MDKKRPLRLVFWGDMFLGGDLERFWYQEKGNPFANIPSSETELVYANIETSFFRGPQRVFRSGHLYSPPDSISGLKYINLKVAGYASNHVMDFGSVALERSIGLLRQHGIEPVGSGVNLNEARQGYIVEKNGWKIGYLAYTTDEFYVRAICAGSFSAGSAPLREDFIQEDIERMRNQVDILCIGAHWGYEFLHIPDKSQIHLGRKMIDWGADVVIGSHPHVVQGYEKYRQGYIFYSLGNAIFPEYERIDGIKQTWNPSNNQSILVRLDVQEIGEQKELVHQIIPLRFDFPYVKEMDIFEKREFELNFSTWNEAIVDSPTAINSIIAMENEVRLRKKRWQRNWCKRIMSRFIIEPMRVIIGAEKMAGIKIFIKRGNRKSGGN